VANRGGDAEVLERRERPQLLLEAGAGAGGASRWPALLVNGATHARAEDRGCQRDYSFTLVRRAASDARSGA